MKYRIEKNQGIRALNIPWIFICIIASYIFGFISPSLIAFIGILGPTYEEIKCVPSVNVCIGSKASHLDSYEVQTTLGGPIDLIYYDKNNRNNVIFVGPISALLQNKNETSFDAQYSARGKLFTFSINNGIIYKITSSARITYP